MILGPAESQRADLIQVIATADAQPREPRYRLQLKTDASGAARRVELTVELPKVSSVSDCQLRISKVSASTLLRTVLMSQLSIRVCQSWTSYEKNMWGLCVCFCV